MIKTNFFYCVTNLFFVTLSKIFSMKEEIWKVIPGFNRYEALEYGVSVGAIKNVLLRRTWSWL